MATGDGRKPALLPMEGRDAAGNLYQVDNIGFLKTGSVFSYYGRISLFQMGERELGV